MALSAVAAAAIVPFSVSVTLGPKLPSLSVPGAPTLEASLPSKLLGSVLAKMAMIDLLLLASRPLYALTVSARLVDRAEDGGR